MRRPEGRLREDIGLNRIPLPEGLVPSPGDLVARALAAGFDRAGIVNPLFAPPVETGEGRSSILVCCLSCNRDEPDDLSAPGDPHGRIAPFARAHYYRAAAVMLQGLAA
ncbi:MAG TPA: hypothetical protein VMM82_12935, partial [Spirochaetia bacterium]|nr:hypothetical protein [Spirochaetia bacterium]